MTREELTRQLNTLRLHGKRTIIWCWVVIVLAGVPFCIYDARLLHLVRAHSASVPVIRLGFTLFAGWVVVFLICIAAMKRTVARYAPKCPHCSGRITGREREAVLASRQCPTCKNRLF